MGLTGIDGMCNLRVSMQGFGKLALKSQFSKFQQAILTSQWLRNLIDYPIPSSPRTLRMKRGIRGVIKHTTASGIDFYLKQN